MRLGAGPVYQSANIKITQTVNIHMVHYDNINHCILRIKIWLKLHHFVHIPLTAFGYRITSDNFSTCTQIFTLAEGQSHKLENCMHVPEPFCHNVCR